MVGNLDQYALVGSEKLETAAGAMSPRSLSMLNFGEHARSSVAELVGVVCMKSSASSMAGAWNWLKF